MQTKPSRLWRSILYTRRLLSTTFDIFDCLCHIISEISALAFNDAHMQGFDSDVFSTLFRFRGFKAGQVCYDV